MNKMLTSAFYCTFKCQYLPNGLFDHSDTYIVFARFLKMLNRTHLKNGHT